MANEYSDLLVELARADERVCVMTAENRAFIRTVVSEIPERLVDVGIAEQNLVGIAAGLAIRGKIPVLHCLAAFLTMRGFEFIRTDLGYQNRNVKLVGAFPGFLSEGNGPTHQAIEDLSLMRGIPNMAVLMPSDLDELQRSLRAALAYPGPVYLRYNERPNRGTGHASRFEIGRGEVVVQGDDVALFSYGLLLEQAVEAARLLLARGISARVVNVRSIKPFDTDLLAQAADETKAIVTVEDHFRVGGLASVVAEELTAQRLSVPLTAIALEDTFFAPGPVEDVIRYERMDGASIAGRVAECL